MKTKISPAIVGAFVIGAFALGTLALLSFGGFHFFDKPERFVVYFDESVHGLDLEHRVQFVRGEVDQPGDAAEGDGLLPRAQPQPGGHAVVAAGLDDEVGHGAEQTLRIGDS